MSAKDNKKAETTTPASAATSAAAAADDKPAKTGKGAKDGERPQTTRGRGGQRGGYGRGRGDRRPQTAKDGEAADGDDTKGAQKGGRGRGGQRGNQGKQAQDPDSWINKFHNLQRPKRDEGEFTADTVIPERPSKEQLLKEPSKSVFESDMAGIDKSIDLKRKEIQAIIKKKKSIREGGFTSGNNTKRDELNQRNNEMKAIRDVKNDLGRKLKDLHAQIDELEGEKAKLLKVLHPKHHTVDQVKQGIKDLDYEMTTRTLNAAQESKLIREISQLKQSEPQAARFQKIDPQIKELKSQKNKVWGELKGVKDKESKAKALVDEIKEELQVTKSEKDDIGKQLDELQETINGINEQIDSLYDDKRKRHEQFWKDKYEHKQQRFEIENIEWLERSRQRVQEQVERKQEADSERQELINNLQPFYSKHIEACDSLTAYCVNLKKKFGLLKESEDVARQLDEEQRKAVVKENLTKKIDEGKVETSMSNAEKAKMRAELEAQRSKKKGKKQKKQDEVVYDEFNFDIAIIKSFALIGVNPPNDSSGLDDTIKKIEDKKQFYLEDTEKKRLEQIEELKRNFEEEDNDLKEAETQNRGYGAAAEMRDGGRGRGQRGGQRGGYGRGGYKGDRGEDVAPRRGRGGYRNMGPKNEFDGGDDDEDQVYAPPSRVQRKQNKKKDDLIANDDNFPALGQQ